MIVASAVKTMKTYVKEWAFTRSKYNKNVISRVCDCVLELPSKKQSKYTCKPHG